MMLQHSEESWLIRMIEIMNGVAERINEDVPLANITTVKLPEDRQVSMDWLRTALVRLTADIRLAADDYDIVYKEAV